MSASRSSTVARLLSRSARLASPRVAGASARHIATARFVVVRSSASQRLGSLKQCTTVKTRKYSTKSYPDHQLIGMPALSPTMTQGNVGQWQKSVGDKIEPGDVLVEIETDKAQMDFEFQDEGYLAKILAPTGTKDLAIDAPVAIIVENESDVAAFADYSADQATSAAAAPAAQESTAAPTEAKTVASTPAAPKKEQEAPSSDGQRIFASPMAKTIAKEKNVDLAQVKGSGPRGRIVKSDVEAFIASGATTKAAATTPAPAAAAPKAAPKAAETATLGAAGFTDIPLTNMRKVIASRLTEAKSTVPHYYLTQNIAMDK
ncbi:pyruvate dehydrogenase complex dihydrolipoamide acetyltransferase component (E2), partial [Coemansia sp. RSA 1933]